MADREGLVNITVENGNVTVDLEVEVLDLPESRDLVIGLPDFPKFGFRLEGVPCKKPQLDVTKEGESDEGIEQEPVVDGLQAIDLSPDIDDLMKGHRMIPLSERSTHPLAELQLRPNPSTPI